MPDEPTDPVASGAKPPFLRRVRIRNYKSIAFCDVTLEPLTILVGRNATGKSNFVDALGFLRDVVTKGVREAVKLHGGRNAVLHRSDNDQHLSIEISYYFGGVEALLPCHIDYSIELDLSPTDAGLIRREQFDFREGERRQGYTIEGQRLTMLGSDEHFDDLHWRVSDRSYLSQHQYIGSCFCEDLALIAAHNFSPQAIRPPQLPTPGSLLEDDGSNLASVILATQEADPRAAARAATYLNAVAESVKFAGVLKAGGYEILEFDTSENVDAWNGPDRKPTRFPAASMSDGTLRAFACLMAAFQTVAPHGSPSLVAIEEPETALHPAAMRALVAAFDEATLRTQILLTTHSPDLLDAEAVKSANVRVVQLVDGKTVIGPVDEANEEIVKEGLASLGRLEREGQLYVDLDDLDRQAALANAEPAHP